MSELIKTNKKICHSCRYGGGHLDYRNELCSYLEKTGNRRSCPVGVCDKYEPIEGKRRISPITFKERYLQ